MNESVINAAPVNGATSSATRWPLLFKILISAALLGLVLYFVDFAEAAAIVVTMNPLYLLAFFGLVHVDRLLMAYKWSPLLQVFNIRIPLFQLTKIYLVSNLAGTILPSTIGGDIFRMYSLSQYKVNGKAVLASIIAERSIGFLAILVPTSVSVILGVYFFRDQIQHFYPVIAAAIISLAAIAIAAWMVLAFRGYRTITFIGKLRRFPLAGKVITVFELFKEYQNHKRTLAKVFGWSVLEQMAPLAGAVLVSMALEIDVSMWALIAVIPVSVFAMRLPISFDGIGIQEGLYVALFGLAGVSAAEALLMSIATRIVIASACLPWAIQYIISRRWTMPAPEFQQRT